MTNQVFRAVPGGRERMDEAAACAPPLYPPFPIFHWSPTSRRKQIERFGFRINMWSIDRMWKPPYVCFANDPHLAWELSGRLHPEIESWDLWQTWSTAPSGMEACIDCRRDNGEFYVKEYRVYERIYRRDIWLVGTRAG